MSPNNHFLRQRCPHCRGNLIVTDQMEQGVRLRTITCLMCVREIRPTEILGIQGNLVARAVPVLVPNRKSHAFQRV